MAKTKHTCFACGAPTEAVVWQMKGKLNKRRICREAKCWKAWWRLADET